jgi:hypothetical protein
MGLTKVSKKRCIEVRVVANPKYIVHFFSYIVLWCASNLSSDPLLHRAGETRVFPLLPHAKKPDGSSRRRTRFHARLRRCTKRARTRNLKILSCCRFANHVHHGVVVRRANCTSTSHEYIMPEVVNASLSADALKSWYSEAVRSPSLLLRTYTTPNTSPYPRDFPRVLCVTMV